MSYYIRYSVWFISYTTNRRRLKNWSPTVMILLHRQEEVAPIIMATLYATSRRDTHIQNTCSWTI